MLRSKIHRATLTGTDLNYEGSIAVYTPEQEKQRSQIFAQIREAARDGAPASAVSRTICCWILLFVAFFVAQECFAAGDLALFGPKRYERAQGKPWAFTDTFNGCATTASQALLRVRNGSSKESSLSSALITLNGTNVLAESDFKNQTLLLERTVTVRPGQNILAVQLKSGGQKETPFLVVEILGQGCSSGDSTPPVVTNPQPADGALLTIPVPVISASYADNAGGTGIDPAAVRVLLDGVDLTPACTVNDTGVSCTPSRGLAEGGHTVTVSVADLAQNPAALTWGFATDTVAPHLTITSPANGQFLGNSTITVGGSIDDATAAVTVNGLGRVQLFVSKEQAKEAAAEEEEAMEGAELVRGSFDDGRQIGDFEAVVKDTAQAVGIKGEPALVRPAKERHSLLDLVWGDASEYLPSAGKLMEKNPSFYFLWK